MSAFLGPIHYKMYERIRNQDLLVRAVMERAAQKGWAETSAAKIDAMYPAAQDRPLADIIDESNIHGWLNEAVVNCERRYAAAVCGALAGHPERMDELRAMMNELGRAHRLPARANAEAAFSTLHDALLDGMPCDFPFAMLDSGADAVKWQVTQCPHARYWAEAGCDVENYYLLRDEWVRGALTGSGLAHARERGEHALVRE